jgi:hypothetical protein
MWRAGVENRKTSLRPDGSSTLESDWQDVLGQPEPFLHAYDRGRMPHASCGRDNSALI